MSLIQETTVWEFPNHIYQTHNGRLIAYMKEGTNEVIHIKKEKGMRFDKSRRKFKNVTDKKIKALFNHE